ncbi:MAG TPA: phosphoribosyl-ATP diphosphatase [Methanoregulaceae archaeon]|nr:phosphoribosyl-ATP diphosphatase [Methanoregulaceae archaeon]
MKEIDVLGQLWQVIDDRFANPRPGSYIAGLAADAKGIDRILEKVGEEATEFIISVKNKDPDRIISEAADLQFHLLVALRAAGISYSDLLDELSARRR